MNRIVCAREGIPLCRISLGPKQAMEYCQCPRSWVQISHSRKSSLPSLANDLVISRRFVDSHGFACFCSIQGFLHTKFSVNEELLAQGLGSIDEVNGFHSNKDHTHFVLGLQKVEQVAKRKGVGVWEGGEYEGRWRKTRRSLRRVFSRGKRKDDSDYT